MQKIAAVLGLPSPQEDCRSFDTLCCAMVCCNSAGMTSHSTLLVQLRHAVSHRFPDGQQVGLVALHSSWCWLQSEFALRTWPD